MWIVDIEYLRFYNVVYVCVVQKPNKPNIKQNVERKNENERETKKRKTF